MEGDYINKTQVQLSAISIHSLRMEGDWRQNIISTTPKGISIHSLRMEGDHPDIPGAEDTRHFNPLPPHGGRLTRSSFCAIIIRFQSTPSAWRETCKYIAVRRYGSISIHSLRMEGDPCYGYCKFAVGTFQSTPSAWRETAGFRCFQGGKTYFNPLPPHGGRLKKVVSGDPVNVISIHSLRMEGDSDNWDADQMEMFISIHSLRMEGDFLIVIFFFLLVDFNPLPPHGGRLLTWQQKNNLKIFQSTPSAWRETAMIDLNTAQMDIFQSTPSAWRETYRLP